MNIDQVIETLYGMQWTIEEFKTIVYDSIKRGTLGLSYNMETLTSIKQLLG